MIDNSTDSASTGRVTRASAYVVIGLGYGDEGKGTTVDWLCRRHAVKTVVRFNGGAQAGHNVVLPDGTHHTFSSFGSGTFAGARTLLSRHVVVDPYAMTCEARVLAPKLGYGILNPLSMVYVDRHAVIVTPWQRAMNKLRELARGTARHGSVGMGVGEAVGDRDLHPTDACYVRDVQENCALVAKLDAQHSRKLREARELAEPLILGAAGRVRGELEATLRELFVSADDVGQVMRVWVRRVNVVDSTEWLADELTRGPVVFEGAQGVLLDQHVGFFPYVTRSTTTDVWAREMLLAAGESLDDARTWGVTRVYQTRHGAGPLPSECSRAELSLPDNHEPHNSPHAWQGSFRVGHLDLVTLQYAARHVNLAGLVVTHTDRVDANRPIQACVDWHETTADMLKTRYHELRTPRVERAKPVIEPRSLTKIAESIGVPIVLESHGPTYLDKREVT